MKSRKGFTLIELMVVVLIVAILAAILVPLLTARLESARWSEGKAGAGTIATSIRALYAEIGEESIDTFPDGSPAVTEFLNVEDLYGKYFRAEHYAITGVVLDPGGVVPVTYTITVSAPTNTNDYAWKVANWTLDETGTWTRSMAGGGT
ncbi:MAG: prepilin-type N-terminal cleavage/methylation domain-containing protein [Planctomycetota bacterium]|jgi:type IV pilus assembly protein PilA